MADQLDREQIDWSLRDREREMYRQAFEAQQFAARANGGPRNYSGAGNGAYDMHYNRAADENAARMAMMASEATADANYAARAQAAAREGNLMKHEARRRQYDSETGRYGAETARQEAGHKRAIGMATVGAMNNMAGSVAQMGNRLGSPLGSGSPGIDLYGADGQRIGGSRPQSPLSSLLG